MLSTILIGCSSHEELPAPNNPFDPGNPDYVSPLAEISSGPGEGEVIDTTEVTFSWQGNETATEYSYQFDGSEWSEWNINTMAMFKYLDEGDHAFAVKSRSLNGDIQLTPTAIDFTVDAVGGPSALVYPYKHIGNPGDYLNFEIIAEEVSELFAVECNILFDNEYLEFIGILDTNIVEQWGGNPLVITNVSMSTLSISMVSVEGSDDAFTGSTPIVTLLLRVKPSAQLNSNVPVIQVSDLTYLNGALDALNISTIRQGVLDVQ